MHENWEAWGVFFLIVFLTTVSGMTRPDVFGLDVILEADAACGAALYLASLWEKGRLNW
jgi:hypothetical protein